MVTLYNTYTRYTHVHYQEFIEVTIFARTGGNRNLAVIRPTRFFLPVTVQGRYLYTVLAYTVLALRNHPNGQK